MRPLGFGCGKREVNRLLLRRDLDPLDLVQLFDPALYLFRFRGLRAKPVDEGLKLLDAFLLVLVRGLELRLPLCFLRQKLLVVARVEVHALVPQLGNLVHRHVQKVSIVRNQDKRKWIRCQIFFQPVARFQVEMVRRLVQKKDVRLLQQQLGQSDSHLPAAGKLFRAPRPVLLLETEAVQHRPDLRLDRVAVTRAKLACRVDESDRQLERILRLPGRSHSCGVSTFRVLPRCLAGWRKPTCTRRNRSAR